MVFLPRNIGAITAAALALGSTAVEAAIPNITGFKLTWGDDFSGKSNSLPSESNWIFTTGTQYPGGAANFGTGEVQTYTKNTANVRQNGNGALEITAIKNSTGGWTSARIETQRKDFMAAAGGVMRIQGSLKLPTVAQPAGYWPAFWCLGASFRGVYTNWPAAGEFDVMENVNGLDKAWGTLHCDVSPGGQCNETTGLGANSVCSGASCQASYHTYTFEVDRSKSPEALRWYLDGKQYWEVLQTKLTTTTWTQTVHNPVFILLNLAMGGSFPNGVYGSSTPLESTTTGGVYSVEYVAVYNK